jgi:hypothetical protein
MALGDPVREHYSAIGVVASEWADLESLVDFCAIKLADAPISTTLCFTAQISGINRKLDAYLAIAKLRVGDDDPLISELNKFQRDAVGISEVRNRIVHDPWDIDFEGTSKRFEVTARKKLKAEWVVSPTADVRKCADHIRLLFDRFVVLHERLTIRLFSSSDTS